jgi:hypothetical protein
MCVQVDDCEAAPGGRTTGAGIAVFHRVAEYQFSRCTLRPCPEISAASIIVFGNDEKRHVIWRVP